MADAIADRILANGKILTVDGDFSTAQAIAIKGERIIAVGANEEILKFKGLDTKIVNLGGRTVIPGLIDNHVHYFRGVPFWRWEVRLDTVNTRNRARELIAEKARLSAPGDWILTVGGWNPRQFTDSHAEFTREELDILAPHNPTFIQYWFDGGIGNSMALKAVGIDSPSGFIASGEAVGGPFGGRAEHVGLPNVIRKALPSYTRESWKEKYLTKMNKDFNRAGITTLWEAGGIHYDATINWENNFTKWGREFVYENGGWSNLRIFHHLNCCAHTPQTADEIIQQIKNTKELDKNDYFRLQGLGEMIYLGTYDLIGLRPWHPTEESLTMFRELLEAAAKKRWQVIDHTMTANKFNSALCILEEIDKTYNIKPLRWSFHHCDQMTQEHIERARKLNMFLGMHPGHRTIACLPGLDTMIDEPPLRSARESGIMWGLGSDSGIVSPYQPFFIMSLAITGKDVAGNVKLLNQTVTRKDALIAQTRSNAWFLFEEDNLGSISPGKYADIVVLNKDYMTVPEKEIKDIESVLTLIGGRVGYIAPELVAVWEVN